MPSRLPRFCASVQLRRARDILRARAHTERVALEKQPGSKRCAGQQKAVRLWNHFVQRSRRSGAATCQCVVHVLQTVTQWVVVVLVAAAQQRLERGPEHVQRARSQVDDSDDQHGPVVSEGAAERDDRRAAKEQEDPCIVWCWRVSGSTGPRGSWGEVAARLLPSRRPLRARTYLFPSGAP